MLRLDNEKGLGFLPRSTVFLVMATGWFAMLAGCRSEVPSDAGSKLDTALNAPDAVTPSAGFNAADVAAIDQKLRSRIAAVLESNLHRRLLVAETNAAWQIMHGVIAYGDALPLQQGDSVVRTTDFLLGGGLVEGWEIAPGDFISTHQRTGVKARLEPGSYIGQGHVDQWLAILAQAGIPLDREVIARDQKFTVLDWARQAQWDVPANPVREYSWTIIALTRYFPEETSWVAKDGKTWTFEPLAEFEANQDLGQSPCGGMHRLTGLAHAVKFRQKHGGELVGGWKAAQDKIDDSIDRIRRFQNADGTFSTNHTVRPGTSADLSATISSTGHTVEFLAFALPIERLSEPWLVKAVDRLCHMMELAINADLDCGGLYHSLNGLKLYYSNRYEPWSPANLPMVEPLKL